MRRLQKAWIFVSHSTLDIEDVRRVRNEVETQGGEPLLFFLKCVSDGDELDHLLKREIEARKYFLLCESENARSSKWVRDEVDYVRSLPGKRVEEIDLDWQWPAQVDAIKKLLKHATLFPCYAHGDRYIVEPLLRELRWQEFSIFDAFDREGPLDELGAEINSAIDDSRYLLDFLSTSSLRSQWCRLEAEYFIRKPESGGHYIPVILERTPSVLQMVNQLGVAAYDFTDRNVMSFVSALERLLYAR